MALRADARDSVERTRKFRFRWGRSRSEGASPDRTAQETRDESPRSGQSKSRFLSPLTRRVLAVNVIALAIPVAGMLFLGPYKDRLIEQEMEALRTQAEIFSGAIGEGAITILDNGQEVINLIPARHIVRRLSGPTRVRARLFLADGTLAADSRQLGTLGAPVQIENLPPPGAGGDVLEPIINGMNLLMELMQEDHLSRYHDPRQPTAADFQEVGRAMNGEIAGMVRETEDGRLILSVAMPVQRYYKVFGALMLSKDGHDIDEALREIRISILAIFAGALIVTVLLSFYLAGAITRPVHRLAEAAENVRRSFGRGDEDIPDFTGRGDEIGDLSGVLRDMTKALRARMTAIERFAADVAHEIKNPLTSLRSAVETAARVKDPEQQQKLMHIILEDVQRLDRLISDISDASRLDAELARTNAEDVDLTRLLDTLKDMHNVTAEERGAPLILYERPETRGPCIVSANDSRLVQVFRNLIENAVSFSPPEGTIRIGLTVENGFAAVTIEDDGPGIPEAKLDAIFDRFYTERPSAEAFGTHSGLGLSISKQIIEAYGGTIRAENVKQEGVNKGARFTIRLPVMGGR